MSFFKEQGKSREAVISELRSLKKHDGAWKDGKTWSLVYYAGEEITKVAEDAYLEFFHTNALNPTVFGSLREIENNVIGAVTEILHGDGNTAGSLTSGGSESILMAVKTYRDEARTLHPEITRPEMILPVSAHASFEKAAHYFGEKPVHVRVDGDFRADTAAVRAAITPNTILLVGSAPSYPQGIIDPIPELGQIALEHKLRLHVDACLGGFILPFLEDIPPFDMGVPGVSSISADLHKYGYAAKGISALLYKDAELRKFQYFAFTDWPGGLFISPSATGTRPGGAIASAWAVLNFLGRDGYKTLAATVNDTAKCLIHGINEIPELTVLGEPKAPVFAFSSDSLNVHALAGILEEKGWIIDQQVNPSCLHFMVTPAHTGIAPAFLADLKVSVHELKEHPELANSPTVALYGLSSTLPQGEVKAHLINTFSDLMTRK
jgi:glutamate/tyrosine decarboxylase-like PLP-dependent enzyme